MIGRDSRTSPHNGGANRRLTGIIAVCVVVAFGALAWGSNLSAVKTDENASQALASLLSADIGQMSPGYSSMPATMALQFEQAGVRSHIWPGRVRRGMREILDSSIGLSDGLDLPGPAGGFTAAFWPHRGMQAASTMHEGRVFHFLMASPGMQRSPFFDSRLTGGRPVFEEQGADRHIMVAIEEGRVEQPAVFIVGNEQHSGPNNTAGPDGYLGPLSFAVEASERGPLLIYRDLDGIYARRLEISQDQIGFGERWQLAAAPEGIAHYQIVARTGQDDTIHVLWSLQSSAIDQSGNAELTYCRIDGAIENGCARQSIISRSVAWDPINLMVLGDRVYVSWLDTRHTSGIWTRRNFAKLYFTRSTDGGDSFARQMSINRTRDNTDNVHAAVTVPTYEGRILVFWAETSQGGGMELHTYQAGWLDAELDRLTLGTGTVSGTELYSALEEALAAHYEGVITTDR